MYYITIPTHHFRTVGPAVVPVLSAHITSYCVCSVSTYCKITWTWPVPNVLAGDFVNPVYLRTVTTSRHRKTGVKPAAKRQCLLSSAAMQCALFYFFLFVIKCVKIKYHMLHQTITSSIFYTLHQILLGRFTPSWTRGVGMYNGTHTGSEKESVTEF